MTEPTALPHASLTALFAHAAERSDVGVTFRGLRGEADLHSYADLALGAERAAAAYRAMGLRSGDRAVLILQTAPDFYHALFGAMRAGVIPACIYPPVRLGRLTEYHARTARMIRAIGARAVVTERTIGRLLGETRAVAGPDVAWTTVEAFADAEPDGAAAHEARAEDVAFIQFSSGTTVDPKPVALTHANVLANLGAMLSRFPLPWERHRVVSWLPLYHDMGLIGALMMALIPPVPLTLIRPDHFVARPAVWLRAMAETRATITVAPNFAYGLCVDRIRPGECDGLDLSAWETALNGAESVHPETIDRFFERFGPLGVRRSVMTPVYGLAEATLGVTFSPMDAEPVRRAFDADALEGARTARPVTNGERPRVLPSLGEPLPGHAIAIRGADGDDLPEGRVGTVWVRGPSVMAGYFGRPEATAEVIRDGWLDTGDAGFLWDGELHLCGREKDLLILRGRNYDPAVVEQAASAVPGVRTGCVAAVATPLPGDAGEGLVVLAERREKSKGPDDAESDDAVAGGIHEEVVRATGLVPHEVVLLAPGTLPRTSSGKIRRAAAHDAWREGTLTPPDRVTWYRMARHLYASWRADRRASAADGARA